MADHSLSYTQNIVILTEFIQFFWKPGGKQHKAGNLQTAELRASQHVNKSPTNHSASQSATFIEDEKQNIAIEGCWSCTC